MSYAVVWSENDGPVYAGRLELGQRALRLFGVAPTLRESRRRVFYDELTAAHMERAPGARLRNRPTLVLDERDGGRIQLSSVAGVGSLHELAEQLETRRAGCVDDAGRRPERA